MEVSSGPWASGVAGAGIESQVFPPSSVLAIVRHGPPVQFEIPSTNPIFDETKLADCGSNPEGSGVPAGATTGGLVVVVEDVVVVVDDVVVVVEIANVFFDEVIL